MSKVFPLFSSKSAVLSILTLRYLIHFEVITVYGVNVQFHSFAGRYPVIPEPILEETILPFM